MKGKLTKLAVNEQNLKRYNAQRNVVKQTGESKLNYGVIKIMCDQDYDGHDIACLLIQFFSKWPDLFLQKRIKRLNTPIYVARKKGQDTKYYYSVADYEKEKSKLASWTVEYMKGLGSLIEEDYQFAINNPRDTSILFDADTYKSLKMAFGDDSQLRKEWLLDNR